MMKLVWLGWGNIKFESQGYKPDFDLNYYAVAVTEQEIEDAIPKYFKFDNLSCLLLSLREAPEPQRIIITFDWEGDKELNK